MKTRFLLPVASLAVPVALALFAMVGGGVGDACWLGMTVESLTAAEAARMGVPTVSSRVVVVKVDRAALASGLIARDVVIGINGQSVGSTATFLATARDATSKRRSDGRVDDVVVTVRRFDQTVAQTVMLTISSEVIAAFGVK